MLPEPGPFVPRLGSSWGSQSSPWPQDLPYLPSAALSSSPQAPVLPDAQVQGQASPGVFLGLSVSGTREQGRSSFPLQEIGLLAISCVTLG